jgi:hypothetical protein
MANDAKRLQNMLGDLARYSRLKGLTVNTLKSKIVVFNSRTLGKHKYSYDGEELGQVVEFKYLGVIFHQDGRMQHADDQFSKSFTIAGAMAVKKVAEHGVSKRIDLSLRLFQAYVFCMAMYAPQIWATPFLHIDKVFESEVQSRHTSFLRRLIRVRQGTCRRSLLHELGVAPLQAHWWRSVIGFWNKTLQSGNRLLIDVLRSDRDLARTGIKTSSWVKEVQQGLLSFGAEEAAGRVMNLLPIDGKQVQALIEARYNAWQGMSDVTDVRREDVPSRKTTCYHRWFRQEAAPKLPGYFSMPQLHYEEVKAVAHFRLGSHKLGVELGRHRRAPWATRVCNRCSQLHRESLQCAVDDEFHLLFECDRFADLRQEFCNTIAPEAFVGGGLVDFEDLQVCKFVSSCMRILEDEEGQVGPSEAEQPAG